MAYWRAGRSTKEALNNDQNGGIRRGANLVEEIVDDGLLGSRAKWTRVDEGNRTANLEAIRAVIVFIWCSLFGFAEQFDPVVSSFRVSTAKVVA